MNPAHQTDTAGDGRASSSELAALEQQAGVADRAHARAACRQRNRCARELAAAQASNRALAERVAEAARRLDALLARLPEVTT